MSNSHLITPFDIINGQFGACIVTYYINSGESQCNIGDSLEADKGDPS